MTDATFPVSPPIDRRTATDRRSWEYLLETVLRPGNWATELAYSLGLQGRLRTSVATIDARRMVAGCQPLRVAFASDFHAGGLTDNRMLANACDAIAAIDADVILFGGDYVSARGADVRRLAPMIAELQPKFGKFGVLGNHDLHANHDIIVGELEDAGVQVLANEHVSLGGMFADVSICGIDDPTLGDPRPDLAMDRAGGTRIVLVHSPDAIEAIGARPFDVALCGHTHGGQIRLPWGRPIVVPGGSLNRLYHGGDYDVGDDHPRRLIVSHGVGCSGLPFRAFAPPEVHLCLIT
jgi:uncharacterized protein